MNACLYCNSKLFKYNMKYEEIYVCPNPFCFTHYYYDNYSNSIDFCTIFTYYRNMFYGLEFSLEKADAYLSIYDMDPNFNYKFVVSEIIYKNLPLTHYGSITPFNFNKKLPTILSLI